MCPEELVATVTALAISISCNTSEEDMEILAVVFTQLGDSLATINAQRARLSNCRGDNDD